MQDGYLGNHRYQSETLVSLTVSLASVVKPIHGEKNHIKSNLEQVRMQVSLKWISLCVGAGEIMGKSGGKEHTNSPNTVCSKQPDALLKIFPLRACSFLNVVIMQNIFPLSPHSLWVCLLQTWTASVETFRNLEESPAQLCRSQPAVQETVLASQHWTLRIPPVLRATTPGLPSNQAWEKQLCTGTTLVNQSLPKTNQCFIVLFCQFFQPFSKHSREQRSSVLGAH